MKKILEPGIPAKETGFSEASIRDSISEFHIRLLEKLAFKQNPSKGSGIC